MKSISNFIKTSTHSEIYFNNKLESSSQYIKFIFKFSNALQLQSFWEWHLLYFYDSPHTYSNVYHPAACDAVKIYILLKGGREVGKKGGRGGRRHSFSLFAHFSPMDHFSSITALLLE